MCVMVELTLKTKKRPTLIFLHIPKTAGKTLEAILWRQYRTEEIGQIDILARDKKTKCFVVIELKKNQTSDDTIGQLTRYMGWIMDKKGDKNVKGIIIAGEYDKKLQYALKAVPNIQVFIYTVDFKLSEFK